MDGFLSDMIYNHVGYIGFIMRGYFFIAFNAIRFPLHIVQAAIQSFKHRTEYP